MKNIALKLFLIFVVLIAFGFETINQFADFETKNFSGNNVSTSSIEDKIIVLHTISSNSPSYKEDILIYKELQDIYVKAFFDRYAKKGLVVITLTDRIIDEKLIPNIQFTFSIKNKIIKELIKKYNLLPDGSNLIISGKREIVRSNVSTDKLKNEIGALLTRDRALINYYN